MKESDHNLMILNMKIKWSSLHEKFQRIAIFNYKNDEDFEKFRSETERNDQLLSCFDDVTDFDIAANKWLKLLNDIIRRCFRKIRLGKRLSRLKY